MRKPVRKQGGGLSPSGGGVRKPVRKQGGGYTLSLEYANLCRVAVTSDDEGGEVP